MTEYPFTTADLAAELDVTPKTIRKWAAELGLGLDLDGRAGFRYSAADRQKLLDSRRPAAPVTPRRKRSRVA